MKAGNWKSRKAKQRDGRRCKSPLSGSIPDHHKRLAYRAQCEGYRRESSLLKRLSGRGK